MTALAPRRARTRLLCLSLTLALTPLAHAQDATDASSSNWATPAKPPR